MSPMSFDSEAIKPCIEVVAGTIQQAWCFLKSDQGHYLFISLAALRAIFHYLGRNPLPEASEFAHVLAITLAVVVAIAATENQAAIKHALQCKVSPSKHPKSSPKPQEIANR